MVNRSLKQMQKDRRIITSFVIWTAIIEILLIVCITLIALQKQEFLRWLLVALYTIKIISWPLVRYIRIAKWYRINYQKIIGRSSDAWYWYWYSERGGLWPILSLMPLVILFDSIWTLIKINKHLKNNVPLPFWDWKIWQKPTNLLEQRDWTKNRWWC